MARQKYYVVWKGREPGIYTTWDECSAQVNGFPGAQYKAFDRLNEARAAFEAGRDAWKQGRLRFDLPPEVIADSVSVDAACDGSPGRLEYRGVYTATGEELFRVGPLPLGTNNLGEFLAIVHALAWLKQQGRGDLPVYSDSRTARQWVRQKRVRSRLPRTEETEPVWSLVDRALEWLAQNEVTNPLLDWDTERWGEIRADFGRK
ncbi:MAG: ribonuclease H [Chloroflexi bacterium]|nr:MAG: ribonuclease H [Chloroflexota bacterium]